MVLAAGSYLANRPIIMGLIRDRAPKRILELGVGSGYYGEMIRRDLPECVLDGVEIFPYDDPRWENYDHLFLEDARTHDFAAGEPYDLYLMVDVIEHMSKDEGLALLQRIPGPVLVSTPYNYPQDGDENPYQEHVSVWTLEDFAEFNYANGSNYLSIILLVEPS